MLLASRKPRQRLNKSTTAPNPCGAFPLFKNRTTGHRRAESESTFRKITHRLSCIFPSHRANRSLDSTQDRLDGRTCVKSSGGQHADEAASTPQDLQSASCEYDISCLSTPKELSCKAAISNGPSMAFMSTPNIIQRNCRNDSATGHPVPMPTQLSGELTLGLDCLKKVVKLPAGEKQCEWIAVHVVDFFNQVNLLYGTITEFCTPRDCPVMSAGDRYQYRWLENKQSSRHSTCLSSKSVTTITSASTYTNSDCGSGYYSGSLANRREGASRAILLPAPDYIDNIMRWGLRMIENLQTLQDQKSASFTQMSSSVVRTLFKRIFRIYAHIYHAHSGAISVLRQEALLNTSFIHFVLFAREFNLIDEREEHPMAEVIALLTNPRMQQR